MMINQPGQLLITIRYFLISFLLSSHSSQYDSSILYLRHDEFFTASQSRLKRQFSRQRWCEDVWAWWADHWSLVSCVDQPGECPDRSWSTTSAHSASLVSLLTLSCLSSKIIKNFSNLKIKLISTLNHTETIFFSFFLFLKYFSSKIYFCFFFSAFFFCFPVNNLLWMGRADY